MPKKSNPRQQAELVRRAKTSRRWRRPLELESEHARVLVGANTGGNGLELARVICLPSSKAKEKSERKFFSPSAETVINHWNGYLRARNRGRAQGDDLRTFLGEVLLAESKPVTSLALDKSVVAQGAKR